MKTVIANFQILDNYINDFSLNIFEKINNDEDLGINVTLGYRTVNIKEKDLIGQIELKYDIDITKNDKKVAKISMTMSGLFKAEEKTDKETFEEMLKINGATTLSHLCRAYIYSATGLAGMPNITLPLINFYEFFKNAKKDEELNQDKNEK